MPKSRLTNDGVQERLDEHFGHGCVSLVGKYIGKREKIKLRCNSCGHIWEVVSGNVLYGKTKHFCPKCLENQRNGTWMNTKCCYCNKLIMKRKKDYKRSDGLVFCSKECSNRYKNNQAEVFSINTYRDKALKYNDHMCACCGCDEDIRILEVHHIDSDRKNNELENLIVLCPICHKKLTLGICKLDKQHNKLIYVN